MDVSGTVLDVSGSVVDISGSVVEPVVEAVVDVSGSVVEPVLDISGSMVDISGTVVEPVVDVSGTPVDVSGSVVEPVVDISGTQMDISGTPMDAPVYVPPPDIISLEDILNEQSLKQQKEDADKQALLTISAQSAQGLKPILVQWAMRGFPAAYPIHYVDVQPPSVCLDGVSRSLYDYIVYLTGKPIEEHVCDLCCKLQGMVVSFANMGGTIAIVVSRAE